MNLTINLQRIILINKKYEIFAPFHVVESHKSLQIYYKEDLCSIQHRKSLEGSSKFEPKPPAKPFIQPLF